jgi:hypothetical protein
MSGGELALSVLSDGWHLPSHRDNPSTGHRRERNNTNREILSSHPDELNSRAAATGFVSTGESVWTAPRFDRTGSVAR